MADQGDMQAHVQTYSGVMALLKWGAIVSIVITFFVIWLIA